MENTGFRASKYPEQIGASGFHMTFENGWTVSVQWGPHTYSDNREASHEQVPRDGWESRTAEVWAFKGDEYDGGEPKGLMTPKQAMAYMKRIAAKWK